MASGPPQRPSGVDFSTAADSSADVPGGARIGPGALALEVAGDKILVNAIAPGPILAPPGTSAEESAAVEKSTPLGRWGGPEAIVQAVLALIETEFITGETIRVDGGRHLS